MSELHPEHASISLHVSHPDGISAETEKAIKASVENAVKSFGLTVHHSHTHRHGHHYD